MDQKPINNCCVLVLSCDKYADIWPPFFDFFKKYWSDCPFPVYLGTNTKEFYFDNVKQLFSGRTTTWSDEFAIILKQIPEKYVIIILEDYFIYEAVENKKLFAFLELMEQKEAAYIKLGAFPSKYDQLWPHTPLEGNSEIGVIQKGSKYRVCLQTAVWNKNILSALLNPSENPWQFEIEASKRSDQLPNPFLCVIADPGKKIVHGPIQYYCTALSAGKWMRGAVKLCKKEKIEIDVVNRPVESALEALTRKFYIALPINMRKGIDFFKNRFQRSA
ncbi:MAG: hypothetical protein JWO32_1091 [Bacteroidetes bacterium]|nr:hypothetical protein [Bacteroidota bacterium]